MNIFKSSFYWLLTLSSISDNIAHTKLRWWWLSSCLEHLEDEGPAASAVAPLLNIGQRETNHYFLTFTYLLFISLVFLLMGPSSFVGLWTAKTVTMMRWESRRSKNIKNSSNKNTKRFFFFICHISYTFLL